MRFEGEPQTQLRRVDGSADEVLWGRIVDSCSSASPVVPERAEVYCSEMRPRDTTPDAHEAQLQAYRRLGAAGRARIAGRLSTDTRDLTRAGIRARHPDYTEAEVEHALRRLLLGDELFRRAWPVRPLLAP